MYLRSKTDISKNKIYWDCRRMQATECKAHAITYAKEDEPVLVIKGHRESLHEHLAY